MLDNHAFAGELDAALLAGDVFAVYQPLIDVDSGAIVGVEGLCRWTDSRGRSVPPDMFIPVAENAGLIHRLGQFMVAECVAAVEDWRANGHAIGVSVNVSPTQLAEESFAVDLRAQLVLRGVPAEAITLEITESLPARDLALLVARLSHLRSEGHGISLDDFGTGHASPDQLARLPVTELKVDRSLMQGDPERTREELRDVIAGARERGLRLVAEGIETADQLQLARDLGCDRVQGFLLGAPMPKAHLDALLVA